MFRALDGAADDDAGCQMIVAMGANAVHGEERAVGIAVKRVGFTTMVKTKDIRFAQIGRRADFDPPLGIGRGVCGADAFRCPRARRRQLAFDVVGGIFHLPENGGKDLAPGGKNRGIGRRTVGFDDRMQLGQRMIRHEREHVVLEMVIHVPVDEAADRVHVNRAAVEAMVQDILSQPGVLRGVVDDHQPCAEKLRQDKQEDGNPALPENGRGDHQPVDGRRRSGRCDRPWGTRFPE